MRKVEFTQEFYKEVYKQIMACQKDYDAGEGFDFTPTIYVEFNDATYQIDIEVTYASEFQDDSFDHAFGTWHDPNAGYYFADGIESIGKVEMWDEESGEEVEGFDEDAFWQQFEASLHLHLKNGDKVLYRNKEYKFVSYNTELGRHKLVDTEGKEIYVWHYSELKKVA